MSLGSDFASLGAWLPIPLLLGAYLGLLAATELVRRRTGLSGEATRKLAHVGGGVIALAVPMVISAPWQAVAVALVSSGFLVAARRMGRLRSIHEVRRPGVGAELYPLGIAAAFVLARGDWSHYALAVLSLAVGDTAAAIAGGGWGRHRFWAWGTARSLEGSAAACATTLAVSLPVLVFAGGEGLDAVLTAIGLSITVAAVEALSPLGTDNLTIPVVAVLVLSVPPAGALATTGMLSLLLLSLIIRGSAARQMVPASAAG